MKKVKVLNPESLPTAVIMRMLSRESSGSTYQEELISPLASLRVVNGSWPPPSTRPLTCSIWRVTTSPGWKPAPVMAAVSAGW